MDAKFVNNNNDILARKENTKIQLQNEVSVLKLNVHQLKDKSKVTDEKLKILISSNLVLEETFTRKYETDPNEELKKEIEDQISRYKTDIKKLQLERKPLEKVLEKSVIQNNETEKKLEEIKKKQRANRAKSVPNISTPNPANPFSMKLSAMKFRSKVEQSKKKKAVEEKYNGLSEMKSKNKRLSTTAHLLTK